MTKNYLGKATLGLRQRAKELRRDATEAEKALWEAIRARRLNGIKFRRQVVIDRFIVDFCSLGARIVIEIDGEIHKLNRENDQLRTRILEESGFRVIRFSNKEVMEEIGSVKQKIIDFCVGPSPLAPPIPKHLYRG
jgi:very-short-patch-repair endonuclease